MFPTQVTSPLRLPQSERRDAERSSNLRIGITIIGISSIRSNNACFRGTSGWAESRKKAEFLEKGGESIEFWLQPNGLHPLEVKCELNAAFRDPIRPLCPPRSRTTGRPRW